jgi:hypothetical protein
MPYEVRKKEGTEDYEVVNSETKEVKATHEPPDAKEKAENQVKLLHEIENSEGWA